MKKTKKRNPQDMTLRNIRALKKRVEKLEWRFERLLSEFIMLTNLKKLL